MNKKDIIEKIAKKHKITKKLAGEVMNTIFEEIAKGMKKGEVRIVGFGTFYSKKRAARRGRNPRTGEVIMIPATKVPKFRPSSELKKRM
ncbi:MAG: HU family DNA-binding protein [Candidatus Diapherotrites archaeon]|nr:HU family DNA-binding protein [Candidatus Diapherotrites archaeon]